MGLLGSWSKHTLTITGHTQNTHCSKHASTSRYFKWQVEDEDVDDWRVKSENIEIVYIYVTSAEID